MPFGLGRALGIGKGAGNSGNSAGRPGGMFGPSNSPMNRGRNMGQAVSNMGQFITGMQRPQNIGTGSFGGQMQAPVGGGMGGPSTDFMSRFRDMVPGGGFAGPNVGRFFPQGPQQMQPQTPTMAPGIAGQADGGMFSPSQGMSGMFGMRKPFGGGGY